MPKAPIGRLVPVTFLIFLAPLCFAQAPGDKTATHGAPSQITGTWRGTSECAQKNGPCHDEINVYRFSEIAGKPGWFSGVGSKVVDGKEIVMGTLEWTYDAEKHTLESTNPSATVRLTVKGNKIDGSLNLPDNTLYRNIHLEKQN